MKVSDELLQEAVEKSTSILGVLRFLGKKEAGGSHSHYSKRIKKLGFDTTHFTGHAHNKGKIGAYKRPSSDILKVSLTGRREHAHLLRRAMIEVGILYSCSKCGQGPEWLGNPLTLDVDHINENWLDNRKENLRFLCPNCHSQFSRKLIA